MGLAYRRWGKRSIDACLGTVCLILAAPVIALIAIAVRISLGAPILFVQQRAGAHGRPFDLFKFRTMIDACDSTGALLPDSRRLTPFGRILRMLSLDELPSLLNVARGDMSLVGPRPLLLKYLPRYTDIQARRHEVRPGVTGLAQVSGRNAITWEQKFDLDVWYVEHVSLLLDVRILLLTAWKVLKREGISEEGEATMCEFRGTGSAGV